MHHQKSVRRHDEWRLYLGRKSTGIVVKPDEKYPSMYRVHWPDLPPSEMANLSRAKDAAWTWIARRGGEQGKSLQWKATKTDGVSSLVR